MKVSIALATYNGAAFLPEQLESLARQSVRPDEIVVCDDGSHDDTLEIVEAFASKEPAISVLLVRNQQRLGYAGNFATAISKCTGEVVFLCDQDDVWLDHKIEKVLRIFSESEKVLLVVNDAHLVDIDLCPTGLTIHKQLIGIGLTSQDNLYGCCMALRRSLIPVILPVPVELMGHDGWLNLIGNAAGVVHRLDLPLQLYRRHGANASNGEETSLTGVGRWKLLAAHVRARRDLRPSAASRIRINTLEAVEARLSREFKRLGDLTGDPEKVRFGLESTRDALRANRARLEIQMQRALCRIIVATRFLIAGGYKEFEGLKSWLRDVAN